MKKNMISCPMVLTLFLACLLKGPGPVWGQASLETVTLGSRMKMTSAFLKEEREFIVNLPANYENTQEKYPVLFLLDGDRLDYVAAMTTFLARCGHIPPLIVVGVLTPSQRHHYRDFTPTKVDYLPASGGAEGFLQFLKQELIPLLESKYRCRPYRILSGHGLSGLFALQTLLASPGTFGAYIATSPSIAFADRAILPLAAMKFIEGETWNKFVFLAAGQERETVPAIHDFEKIMKSSTPRGLQWQCWFDDREDQGSIAFSGLYLGLKALYADWRFPAGLADEGFPALEKYFLGLSQKYGYIIPLNDDVLVKRSTQLFQEQGFADALRILQLTVTAYPESFQAYYFLGFVCEKIKDFVKAGESYQSAFIKAEAAGSPMAGFYKQQAERIAREIERK